MAMPERPGIADFYEREVLPALNERLDQAFPEFGWTRDPRGWHATNQSSTHQRYYEHSVAQGLDDYYAGRGESPAGSPAADCALLSAPAA